MTAILLASAAWYYLAIAGDNPLGFTGPYRAIECAHLKESLKRDGLPGAVCLKLQAYPKGKQ